jgi:hypothetical protein
MRAHTVTVFFAGLALVLGKVCRNGWTFCETKDRKAQVLCGGVTAKGFTHWEVTKNGDVSVRIPSSKCEFSELAAGGDTRSALFFVSIVSSPLAVLRGTTSTAKYTGTAIVYDVQSAYFRVFVQHESLSGADLHAFAVKYWQISWIGAVGANTGQTTLGKTGWVAYQDNVVWADISTRSAGFQWTPRYLITLQSQAPVKLEGEHAVYDARNSGFKVYVKSRFTGLAPRVAEAAIVVNWIGADPAAKWAGSSGTDWRSLSMGQTASNPEATKQTNLHVAQLGVAAPGFGNGQPLFVTSIQRDAQSVQVHWLQGASTVMYSNSSGFEATLTTSAVRDLPNWKVNYIAFAQIKPCQVSSWSEWTSTCSTSCGKGYFVKKRTITRMPTMFAQGCPALMQTKQCRNSPCPVNCETSPWTAWSPCSNPCGGGLHYRTRTVSVPPKDGGACSAKLKDSQKCNLFACVTRGFGPSRPCGSTTSHIDNEWGVHTQWGVYAGKHEGGLFVDVDTGSCDFHGKVFYTASVVSDVAVISSIFRADATSFRINVWHPTLKGKILQSIAQHHKWQISWIGDTGSNSGMTVPGRSNWQQNIFGVSADEKKHAYIHVDTSSSAYSSMPIFLTGLYGAPSRMRVVGAHDLYLVSKAGFRLFTLFEDEVTPADLEETKLAVTWMYMPKHSAQSSHDWKQDGDSIYLDVNSANMDLPATPGYATSLVITGPPQEGAYGASSVSRVTLNSFRFVLKPAWSSGRLHASDARQEKWRVNYAAFLKLDCKTGVQTNGTCTKTCGGGTRQKTLRIVQHPYHGKSCPLNLSISEACHTAKCPVDCKLTHWSSWHTCSVTCGSGTRTRHRQVLVDSAYGGALCPPLSDTSDKKCNVAVCPVAHPRVKITGTIVVSQALRWSPRELLNASFVSNKRHQFLATVATALNISNLDVHLTFRPIDVQAGRSFNITADYSIPAANDESGVAIMQKFTSPIFCSGLLGSLSDGGITATFSQVSCFGATMGSLQNVPKEPVEQKARVQQASAAPTLARSQVAAAKPAGTSNKSELSLLSIAVMVLVPMNMLLLFFLTRKSQAGVDASAEELRPMATAQGSAVHTSDDHPILSTIRPFTRDIVAGVSGAARPPSAVQFSFTDGADFGSYEDVA